MMETERLKSLFAKLYNGHPWIDINLMDVLCDIPAAQAAERPLENANSIWEIVNHMISWRRNVLRRVQGQVIQTPDSNYVEPVQDTSEQAWQLTIRELESSQRQWLELLNNLGDEDLDRQYVNGMTYYEHINGILQHDAYHLGQIVLLAKQ